MSRLLAILVLECFGIVAWLATSASLAAVYDVLLSFDQHDFYGFDPKYDDDLCDGDMECLQMISFMARDSRKLFGPVLMVALILSGIQL